jgi:betaine-aldehyde dehydrogenase
VTLPDVQPAGSHVVDGRLMDDRAGAEIAVVYPATGEWIATVHAATPAVIEAALAGAVRAQAEWAGWTGAARALVLRRAAAIIRDRNRALSVIETLDTGKPLSETLVADAASGADALDHFAALAEVARGRVVDFGADRAVITREPFGVCLGIGAWNYPTQIACWKAAPALAAGNAMVFKPSEVTPLGALQVGLILAEAGVPPGLYQVVQGAGDVGAALLADARVAKVSLTGSVATGRRVAAAAAERLVPVTLELGGKSPLIVFEDADLDAAVSGAILGNFYSSGQVCSNGTRVFVERPLVDRFLRRLVERMAGINAGDPLDEATNFGPLVSAAQADRVAGFIGRAEAEGARLVIGGRRMNRPGFWVEPTVFADVTDGMEIARDEVFGPVMSVLSFDTEDEVVARANATPFGLAAGVFSRDVPRARRVLGQIAAGTGWINAYNLTPAGMPFGGVKGSGYGRENAAEALESYSWVRTVYEGASDVAAPY